MTDITWQEPPASKNSGRPKILTDEILAELRANPGRWALIYRAHNSAMATLWKKRHPDLETTVRTVPGSDPKMYDIYARATEPVS